MANPNFENHSDTTLCMSSYLEQNGSEYKKECLITKPFGQRNHITRLSQNLVGSSNELFGFIPNKFHFTINKIGDGFIRFPNGFYLQ